MPLNARQISNITVVWTASGTLYAHQADVSTALVANNAVQPFLSPDGDQIGYTSGEEGLPLSLWVTSSLGEPRQFVTPEQISNNLIDQIAWLGNESIYFNTSTPNPPLGITPNNDLWRVDVTSGELTTILGAGNGGAFTISPNEQHIAIVRPGTFDEAGQPNVDGDIRVIAEGGSNETLLHTFKPIQSASHIGYYPLVKWLPDDTALYTAIPPTLFNPFDTPATETTLWQITRNAPSVQIGVVSTGYGRFLNWSADANHLYYGVTPSSATQGTSLVVAGSDGTNGSVIADDVQGGLVWSKVGARFAYLQDRQIIIGEPQNDTVAEHTLPEGELLLRLGFPDENTFVYLTASGAEFALYAAQISGDAVTSEEIFRGQSEYGIAFDVYVPN